MTAALALSCGPSAAADLERMAHGARTPGRMTVSHEGHAVAWSGSSPWVSSCDDGAVLVVVDGRLHDPAPGQRTAAELLLERYLAMGAELARGVLGDFVAVVLDRPRRSLVVCRDPLGARPWYQAASGPRSAGASDVASLLSLPWVSDEVDDAAALAFLAGRSESRGRTLHRDIATLRPGTTWRSRPGSTSSWSHFTWQLEPEPTVSWDEAVARCREVLDDAVRCRVAALGAAASELSGGLDSSAVVGTAVLLGHHDVVVGRLLFDGPAADERQYSAEVAERWHLDTVSAPPTVLSWEQHHALAASLRRPVPDPNFVMFTNLHGALAARGRPGILTGLGGDDAFVDTGLENRLISAVQQRRREVLSSIARATVRSPRAAWRHTLRPVVRSLLPRARRLPPAYIAPGIAARAGLTELYARPPVPLTGVRSIDVRAGGLTSGQVAANLEGAAVVDDLTGVRRSHPFLDPRVITATYGLDPEFPVRNGHYRALEAAAYADRVPASVSTRQTKAEFSETVWPLSLRSDVLDRISSGPLVERGWLDLPGLRNVLADARAGRPHAALPLARMTALDEWLRQVDG